MSKAGDMPANQQGPEIALHIEGPQFEGSEERASGTSASIAEMERSKNTGQTGQEVHGFEDKYALGQQIGSGASSTVWRCTNKATAIDYAAKVIDLRPLSFRENFSIERLRREVDIMQRLHHPSIVQLVEVFHSKEKLILVMEYMPGVELFDAILAKQRYSEAEAKPIFLQIARAIQYLHQMNIIHRDIKPENVIVQDARTADGLYPQVKLLDFGLSKAVGAGMGSAAKTYVGTPCYLAPEVQMRGGTDGEGQGRTYGTGVDCWSLGAVLYVMLSARFPEFHMVGGKQYIRMTGPLWEHASEEAKDLIRGLMAADPSVRTTIHQVLVHPWLAGISKDEGLPAPMPQPPLSTCCNNTQPSRVEMMETPPHPQLHKTAQGLTVESLQLPLPPTAETMSSNDGQGAATGTATSGSLTLPQQHAEHCPLAGLAVQPKQQGAGGYHQELNIAPLFHLHNSISQCMETAVESYIETPAAAASLRESAVLCRENLVQSTKLLRKIEHTASQVLGVFADLKAAVEEGEPQLAHDFFSMLRGWVRELYAAAVEVQVRNKENTNKISELMQESVVNKPLSPVDMTQEQKLGNGKALFFGPRSQGMGLTGNLDEDAVRRGNLIAVDEETFALIRKFKELQNQGGLMDANISEEKLLELFLVTSKRPATDASMTDAMGSDQAPKGEEAEGRPLEGISSTGTIQSDTSEVIADGAGDGSGQAANERQNSVKMEDAMNAVSQLQLSKRGAGAAKARANIKNAVKVLHEVDGVLEQLALFWANTEVIFDVLLQKAETVEQFVRYAHKPRLLQRFDDRLTDYQHFWEGIRQLCISYLTGASSPTYSFLDKAGTVEHIAATHSYRGHSHSGSSCGDSVAPKFLCGSLQLAWIMLANVAVLPESRFLSSYLL
ncbi:unnamed protein product [Chrysoparadoxa australica]